MSVREKKQPATSLRVYNSGYMTYHSSTKIKNIIKGETYLFEDLDTLPITVERDTIAVVLKGDLSSSQHSVEVLNHRMVYISTSDLNITQDLIGENVIITTKTAKFEGRLLKWDSNSAIIKREEKIVIVSDIISIEGENTIDESYGKPPSIDIDYKSTSNMTNAKLEVSYVADEVNWDMGYVVILSPDFKSITMMRAVATVTNNSGKTYKDVGISFISGNANKTYDNYGSMRKESAYLASAPSASRLEKKTGSSETEISEYFEYDKNLYSNNELPNNRSTEFELFTHININSSKISALPILSYLTGSPKDKQLRYGIEFKNKNSLPGGNVTVYQETESDILGVYLGKQSIETKTKGSLIRLRLGNTMHITSSYKVTKEDKQATGIDAGIEKSKITIEGEIERQKKNKELEDIVVRVLYPVYGKVENMKVLIDGKEPNSINSEMDEGNVRFDIPIFKNQLKIRFNIVFEIRYLY